MIRFSKRKEKKLTIFSPPEHLLKVFMNPIISHLHSADPAAHVWPGDDRLWIYGSHDQPGTNTHDTMECYHVFSSSDLVHWTDYGIALHLKDVKWAISHMWAIDAVLWKGTYYLVFCAIERDTGEWRTGLATSPRPEGPFVDAGFIQGVVWGQDPSLFVDDDGTPYLYRGACGRMFGAELQDDLRAVVPGTEVELTDQLQAAFEGPFVHKYQGKYYLSYPGLTGGEWPEEMYYAVSDKPLGPYKSRGVYIPQFKGCAGTNHGSIIEYKGRWLALHHSSWISGIGQSRSLMIDYLEYDERGDILPIVPSVDGVVAGEVMAGEPRISILLYAATAEGACGQLHGTHVAHARTGHVGPGYVTGFDRQQYGLTVVAQSAVTAVFRLKIRYAAPGGNQQNKILVNHTLLDDPNSPDPTRYDKAHVFPRAEDWTELDAGLIELRPGDNTIRLYRGTGGIDVDYLKLELV